MFLSTRVSPQWHLAPYVMEGEGQNVGGVVLLAELAIELLDVRVRREQHTDVPTTNDSIKRE